ncbi:MAG: insulinase family protein [Phycisphaerales bacterium]|nr:insulinase family protein [Phycisphaerales bacterium]
MSQNHIRTFELACGMPLVVEPFPTAGSAAIAWLLPLGSACYPDPQDGLAPMLAELMMRGVEGLDSRQHSDALDRLGVQRSVHVSTYHLHLGAVVLGSKLEESLPLVAAMVRSPSLPESALEPTRSLCLQSLEGLDDDPQELAMVRLKERHLPPPLNRHSYGRRDVLESCPLDAIRSAWRRGCVPVGSVLAVAGRCDPDRVASQMERLLAGWEGEWIEPVPTAAAVRGHLHLPDETAQTHLGLAWEAPREGEPGSMAERIAVRVLGGGSSSRLFSEVREKRGLCYSVGASYTNSLRHAMVTVYAGSTPQRAQQTVDVIMEQVRSMRHGVSAAEFHRAVAGFKSRLVMQGESTSARSATLASDQFRLGRPRSLAEIAAEVDRLTQADLDAWVAQRVVPDPTLVAIGPAPVEVRPQ